MSGSHDRSSTERDLGELKGLVQGVNEQLNQLRGAQQRQEERVNVEAQGMRAVISNVQTEQIRSNTAIQMQVASVVEQVKEMAQMFKGLGEIRDRVRDIAGKVDALEELKKPVARALSGQSTAYAYLAGMGALAFVLWEIFGPSIKGLIAMKLGLPPGGH